MDDTTALLAQRQQSSPESGPLYHDTSHSPTQKLAQSSFVVFVAVMVGISLFLGIYRGATVDSNGGIFFMISLSLLGFVVIQLCVLTFLRRGELATEKTWFLFAVGFAAIIESILTNVLLFGDA